MDEIGHDRDVLAEFALPGLGTHSSDLVRFPVDQDNPTAPDLKVTSPGFLGFATRRGTRGQDQTSICFLRVPGRNLGLGPWR